MTTTATATRSAARKASSHNLRSARPSAAASGLQDLRSLLAAERMSGGAAASPSASATSVTTTTAAANSTNQAEYTPAAGMPAPGSVTLSHGFEYRYDAKSGQYLLAGTYAPLSSPGYAYLLVEDATQTHRPVYMEIFQYPKEHDELPPWPVLYNDGEGRCPFSAPSSTRRHATPSPNATRSLRVVLDEHPPTASAAALTPYAHPRGSTSSYLSFDLLDPHSTAGTPANTAVPVPAGMVDPTTTLSTRAPTPLGADDSMMGMVHHPPSGLSISGMGMTPIGDLSASQLSIPSPQAQRTTSTVVEDGKGTSALLDPRMAALVKRPTVPTLRPATKQAQPHVQPTAVRACMAQRALGPQPPPVPRKRARDKKPGYCENCRAKFDDLEEHINSRRHVRFAQNDENFAALDVLLDSVARTPLGTLLSSRPTSISLSVEG